MLGNLFYYITKETKLEKSDIYSLFENYNRFLIKRLEINEKEYALIFNIIFNNKRSKYTSPRYDMTIHKICKKISKKILLTKNS